MAARSVQGPDDVQLAGTGAPSEASFTVIAMAAPAVDWLITSAPTTAPAPNAVRARPASNRAISRISSTSKLVAWVKR
jgi:hypothetical protein